MTDEEFADAMRRLPPLENINFVNVQNINGYHYYIDVVHTINRRTFHMPLMDNLSRDEASVLYAKTKQYIAALKRLTSSGS